MRSLCKLVGGAKATIVPSDPLPLSDVAAAATPPLTREERCFMGHRVMSLRDWAEQRLPREAVNSLSRQLLWRRSVSYSTIYKDDAYE